MQPQLVQTQSPSAECSVSVWRELEFDGHALHPQWLYRKVWASDKPLTHAAWLSWAHHEHLILTLLAGRGATQVVQVSGLKVSPAKVELTTLDAGDDLEREWLSPAKSNQAMLWADEYEALKFARACLLALQSIHRLGMVHGDLKSDNICVTAFKSQVVVPQSIDLKSLRLIDFAYAMCREAPLQFVLPTDPFQLEYMPPFYRETLANAQLNGDLKWLNSITCANIDLFSLSCMLEKTICIDQTEHWSDWQHFLSDCRQTGEICTVHSTNATERNFEAPTVALLEKVEYMLVAKGIPRSEWMSAQTTLSATVAPTPMLVTARNELDLTPLLSKPQPKLEQLLSNKSGEKFIQWPMVRAGILYVLMLFACWIVDLTFRKYQIRLTDTEYVLSLLAMVNFIWFNLTLFSIGRTKSRLNLISWQLPTTALVMIMIYFEFNLPFGFEMMLLFFMTIVMVYLMMLSDINGIFRKVAAHV